jgi:hypothetical protein
MIHLSHLMKLQNGGEIQDDHRSKICPINGPNT